jgi:hypothetical protein
MRSIILAAIASVSLSASAAAFDLSPGAPFPEISLPQTKGGELANISAFHGKKLMLHLFASW